MPNYQPNCTVSYHNHLPNCTKSWRPTTLVSTCAEYRLYDGSPCGLAQIYRRFEGTYCLNFRYKVMSGEMPVQFCQTVRCHKKAELFSHLEHQPLVYFPPIALEFLLYLQFVFLHEAKCLSKHCVTKSLCNRTWHMLHKTEIVFL
jgi:hypothetical protein